MPDATTFGLFLGAALVVAVTPGPGILYVLTRSLKGGRGEGFASSFGNGAGDMAHVAAAAFGLSAVLMASATAFAVVKWAGVAYLVYLGVRTLLGPDRGGGDADAPGPAGAGGNRDAFRQGVVSEVLNPKAALFFLAFLPQFVDPARGPVVFQTLLLGCAGVAINTGVGLAVAFFAGPVGTRLRESARLRLGQRLLAGCTLIGLGAYLAVSGERK